MIALMLWENIKSKARESEFEINTVPQNARTPLWFLVGIQGNYLIVRKAILNRPSVNLSMERKISYKDFETVFSFYQRWLNGEPGISHEVAQKSKNSAYIFALIAEGNKISV